VPDGPRWAFEVKHGGFRFIARRDDAGLRPGDGWQLLASAGKGGGRGERGEQGARGPASKRGPKGEPGSVFGFLSSLT